MSSDVWHLFGYFIFLMALFSTGLYVTMLCVSHLLTRVQKLEQRLDPVKAHATEDDPDDLSP